MVPIDYIICQRHKHTVSAENAGTRLDYNKSYTFTIQGVNRNNASTYHCVYHMATWPIWHDICHLRLFSQMNTHAMSTKYSIL